MDPGVGMHSRYCRTFAFPGFAFSVNPKTPIAYPRRYPVVPTIHDDSPDKRDGVSNTFFTRTLFTDDAIRALLSLYRPGRGKWRDVNEDTVLTGSAPILEELIPGDASREALLQAAREEKTYSTTDPDTRESIILASLGSDVDGGLSRLHGGVTAMLLDQAMEIGVDPAFTISGDLSLSGHRRIYATGVRRGYLRNMFL
ncbi:hypothetical protein EJ02DRAFT_468648 [Clathrospora elynae]|uniref:Thioesterase domain-containing protein n=1 Tax=Clathrospora elynae TaxID=706981 RepID=A0A6A5SFB3_9PLEO|nr:hypothetical protein EJ02DRAFT_468648 [Clathrospora elynae]